ncbi:MAG: peroxiredoxin family protein [Pirellulales bacterium]|nr:AhpC/TSA family protein [Planctomycetales bacterium]
MSRRYLLLQSLVIVMLLGGLVRWAGAAEEQPPAVGDTVPDFELEDLDGQPVKLSELAKDGPVVIVMLRGWPGYQCPICSRQVGQLVGKADELAELGARVVLVYPGPADGLTARAQEFVRGNELPENFRFVTDPAYQMTAAYHLRWDAERETAYPSTFIVDPKRKVTFAKVSKSHGGRTQPDEIIAALKK